MKNEPKDGKRKITLEHKGALIHPNGRVRSAEGFISAPGIVPCAEIGGFAADRGSYTSPATACAVYPFVYPTKANTLLRKLFTFVGFC